jgi:hypothetical protein
MNELVKAIQALFRVGVGLMVLAPVVSDFCEPVEYRTLAYILVSAFLIVSGVVIYYLPDEWGDPE